MKDHPRWTVRPEGGCSNLVRNVGNRLPLDVRAFTENLHLYEQVYENLISSATRLLHDARSKRIILCLCDRASLVQLCKQPTRCNNFLFY